MFDIDQFLADCREAGAGPEPRRAIRNVLERAMAKPDEVAAALRPTQSGFTVLDGSPELTVLHVVWAPHMTIYPHDHRMWAAIGIYAGQEDNSFYRRSGPDRRELTESGGKQLVTGDVVMLGDDTIHGVTNPRDRLTGAIHVYGGDFVNQPRSQWGPGERVERPYDIDQALSQFTNANRALDGTAEPPA
jgi:predicted metal-dependent enzyme (double-stranded beta helix superfamily)